MKSLALAALLSIAAVPAFAEGTNESSTSFKQVATETTFSTEANIEPAAGPEVTKTRTIATGQATTYSAPKKSGISDSFGRTISSESTPDEVR